MFNECVSLRDISPLKTWDVSNGLYFRCMFRKCISLKKVDGIEIWIMRNDTDTFEILQIVPLENINQLKKKFYNNNNHLFFFV